MREENRNINKQFYNNNIVITITDEYTLKKSKWIYVNLANTLESQSGPRPQKYVDDSLLISIFKKKKSPLNKLKLSHIHEHIFKRKGMKLLGRKGRRPRQGLVIDFYISLRARTQSENYLFTN